MSGSGEVRAARALPDLDAINHRFRVVEVARGIFVREIVHGPGRTPEQFAEVARIALLAAEAFVAAAWPATVEDPPAAPFLPGLQS